MTLFVGAHVLKKTSNRTAQVSALDATHVWLYWLDNGAQTTIRRKRLNRNAEWERA